MKLFCGGNIHDLSAIPRELWLDSHKLLCLVKVADVVFRFFCFFWFLEEGPSDQLQWCWPVQTEKHAKLLDRHLYQRKEDTHVVGCKLGESWVGAFLNTPYLFYSVLYNVIDKYSWVFLTDQSLAEIILIFELLILKALFFLCFCFLLLLFFLSFLPVRFESWILFFSNEDNLALIM